jgi:hypothetical protein
MLTTPENITELSSRSFVESKDPGQRGEVCLEIFGRWTLCASVLKTHGVQALCDIEQDRGDLMCLASMQ